MKIFLASIILSCFLGGTYVDQTDKIKELEARVKALEEWHDQQTRPYVPVLNVIFDQVPLRHTPDTTIFK